MHAITWRPGTDTLWDPLFEHLRERNYRNQDHPLWKNYNQDHFYNECLALTIAFNQYGMPVLCASILNRSCWPSNTYRIINRLWSVSHSEGPIRNLMPEGEHLLRSQINWLKEHTEVELIFISREAPNWQQWTVDQYKHNYNLEFEYDHHRYQVCDNATDESCWQRIVYQGNQNLLEQWSRK
jgi:hypothetical protein